MMNKSPNEKIERMAREERKKVARMGGRLGLNGVPVTDWSVYLPNIKPKKKGGRPKRGQSLSMRERLRQKGYFD